MDTQAVINSAGNPAAPKLKQINSSSLSKKDSSTPVNQDKVNISQKARSLAQTVEVSPSEIVSTGIEQRKFSFTENNDVVLEVIDPQTQEVVRTVPSEEQLELRNAIRNELDKI
jgi:uncharacterized FlaG/YvyC family protein